MHPYEQKNLALWNALSEVHWKSKFYDIDSFIKTGNSLPRLDQTLLGDVQGKITLHLQCHLGLESISLARLGAQVTAVDFSSNAIKYARHINNEMGTSVEFIEENIYNLLQYDLKDQFDLIYTSYGVVPWLSDLNKWSDVIYLCLKPGGRFVLIDFHPMIFTIDDRGIFSSHYGSSYQPEEFTMEKSYTGDPLNRCYSEYNWNHSLSQIIDALNKNMKLESIQEYDYSSYPCFSEITQVEPGKYKIKSLKNFRFPHMFSTIFAYH